MPVVIFFLSLFLLLGCSQTSKNPPSQMHKLRADTVKRLMHEIDGVMYRYNRSEIERDDDKQRYAITLALQLRHMSERIEVIIDDAKIDACKEDKTHFKSYAATLREHADTIKGYADVYDFERVDAALGDTLHLCNRCHEHFCVSRAVLEHYR